MFLCVHCSQVKHLHPLNIQIDMLNMQLGIPEFRGMVQAGDTSLESINMEFLKTMRLDGMMCGAHIHGKWKRSERSGLCSLEPCPVPWG